MCPDLSSIQIYLILSPYTSRPQNRQGPISILKNNIYKGLQGLSLPQTLGGNNVLKWNISFILEAFSTQKTKIVWLEIDCL